MGGPLGGNDLRDLSAAALQVVRKGQLGEGEGRGRTILKTWFCGGGFGLMVS